MRKFYYPAVVTLTLMAYSVGAQQDVYTKGSVTFRLDNSKNDNKPIDAVYIILDRFDLTGAGVVKDKYETINNKISIQNLPTGKYYADIFIKGFYNQHFSRIIDVTKKGKTYTFKIAEIGFYEKGDAVIPKESNDYSKTSVVFMKSERQLFFLLQLQKRIADVINNIFGDH